ncbi:MAG: hypothetical protein ACRD04_09155 [Terriglobales bacterium]
MTSAAALPQPLPSRAVGRDDAVDMIKGLACLLMVVAHVPFPHARWLAVGTEASVLFFASTGMNLWHISARARGDEARIAANGLFLIFAGFANNYVQGTLWQADVFQSAGMAMIAMLALRWLLPRFWTWLFPLPYALHYLNAHLFYWKTTAGGVSSFFLAPGLFPLLPWLTFYLLGAHLKRFPARSMRIAIALASLLALAAVVAAHGFRYDKFWMSPDYWLLGLAYATLLLDLFRYWLAHRPRRRAPWAELRYWGANSLVFYILHAFVIRLLQIWWPSGLFLFVAAVAGTAALLRAGLALQDWTRARGPWPVLAVCAALSGGVLALEATLLHGYYLRTFSSFILTLSFVAVYPAFKNLSALLPRRRSAIMASASCPAPSGFLP